MKRRLSERFSYKTGSIYLPKQVRTLLMLSVRLLFALDHQRVFRQICLLAAEVLDLLFILLAQVVKSQTIPFGIHNLTKGILQAATLCCVQQTLKYRILHSLTVVDALFGDLPQASASGGVLCVYIIGDQYQHRPLTSIKTADSHPDRPADTLPTRDSAHKEPAPKEASPPETDE